MSDDLWTVEEGLRRVRSRRSELDDLLAAGETSRRDATPAVDAHPDALVAVLAEVVRRTGTKDSPELAAARTIRAAAANVADALEEQGRA